MTAISDRQFPREVGWWLGVMGALILIMVLIAGCYRPSYSSVDGRTMMAKPPASQIHDQAAFDSLYGRAAYECSNAPACSLNIMLGSKDSGVVAFYRYLTPSVYKAKAINPYGN